MKYFFQLFFCVLLIGVKANGQAKDSLPPYLQVPIIPPFKLTLLDGSFFMKKDLPKKTVVVTYFSPECGHCQGEAERLIASAALYNNKFFVWASYHDIESIKAFCEKYGLHKLKNVVVGRDADYFIPTFYRVKFTPFSAVYNKKGNLIKAYADGLQWEELKQL